MNITLIPVTMTSREIAELTGKELFNVHRDIRAMLDDLKIDDSNLNHPQDGSDVSRGSDLGHVREDKDERGYTTCFHLDKELTYTLLTGYSAVLRRKIIRRLEELEAQAHKPLDMSRFIYIGREHDPSQAGMYYAALESKVLPTREVARKYGLQTGFVEALKRLRPCDVASMGRHAGNGSQEVEELESKHARIESTKQKVLK